MPSVHLNIAILATQLEALLLCARVYERYPPGTMVDGKNVGGKFMPTDGGGSGSADQPAASSMSGVADRLGAIDKQMPSFGLDGASRKIRQNMGTTATALAANVQEGLPIQSRKSFNGMIKTGAAAMPDGFKKAMSAATSAGQKAIKTAKEHPVETTIGVIAAYGLLTTGAALVGAIAAEGAMSAGVAEFLAASEGAELSAEAKMIAKTVREVRRPLIQLQERLASGELSLADLGLKEGEEFVIASEKELASMLNVPGLMKSQTLFRGLVGTAYAATIGGVIAQTVKNEIEFENYVASLRKNPPPKGMLFDPVAPMR